MSRRRTVPRALALVLLGLTVAAPGGARAAQANTDPRPRTPIEHFVVLMQSNRSFDHYFGTYPGAEGVPKGTCLPFDASARTRRPSATRRSCVAPFHLGRRPVQDLPHARDVFRREYAQGRMDGFVAAQQGAGIGAVENVMGYYDDRELPFYWNVARDNVLFDRYFTSAADGSFKNRVFWVAGAPPTSSSNQLPPEGLGGLTIFDRLEERGISWKFYVENYDSEINYRGAGRSNSPQVRWVPPLYYARFIDDPKLSSRIVDLDEYYEDLEKGTLPSVAYVATVAGSEHPPGSSPPAVDGEPSLRVGQQLVRTMLNTLMRSSSWSSSAFMWSYDDWGGWYDHVPPPRVDRYGYGFRAPALLVSPYARRGHVDSTVLDHTSPLKFIEQNWGLKPLARRDARANSIASAFDFTRGPRAASLIPPTRGDEPRAEPRRSIIYGIYGGAFALAMLVVVSGAASAGGRRRRGPIVRGEEIYFRAPGSPDPALPREGEP